VETHEWGGIYLDHGESGGVVGYPGQSRSDILRDFPDYILPESITDEGWWKEGREERSVCQGRALKVAERLLDWSNSDQSVAMVSHGDFVDALLKALFSQLPGRNLYYRHWNTGITRIGLGGGDPLKIWYMNRIDHLEPGLIS
jgi:broad specificity phosphatase PhoE